MNANELCMSVGKSLSSLFEFSPGVHEGIHVRTPLLYPDGGFVDVCVGNARADSLSQTLVMPWGDLELNRPLPAGRGGSSSCLTMSVRPWEWIAPQPIGSLFCRLRCAEQSHT